jgi:tetratricopeptide (TPR) repeat protein
MQIITRPFPVAFRLLPLVSCVVLGSLGPAAAAQENEAGEAAWRKLFAEGIAAYQSGDEDGAIAKWEAANRAYDGRPEAYNNIAVILADRGDHERAALVYVNALEVFPRMRAPLDSERGERLASRRDVHQGLLASARELFREGNVAASAAALQALTAADPANRDAFYNLGLALYKLERWADLVPVARRSVELEPLSQAARTLLFNASKGQNVPPEAGRSAVEALPVHLDEIQMVGAADRMTLRGVVTGAAAPEGTPIRLEVTAYDTGDTVGTGTVTIEAPARGRKAPFSAAIPTSSAATSYSYRLVE